MGSRIESQHLPPLPNVAVTRDGFRFDPRLPDWYILGLFAPERLKFSEFVALSPDLVHSLKVVVLWHLQNSSYSHARNLFQSFARFYRHQYASANTVSDTIELRNILNFRAGLDGASDWKLGVLRILLEDMQRLGVNVTSQESLDYLRDATIRGNIKGTSIRTRDPSAGSFSDGELLAIQAEINDAYASGRISLYNFAVTWLFLGYGPRPIQIAALKENDLIVSEGKEGRFYALRIPRAKQRGHNFRSSFKTRYCSKQIGQLLEEVILQNRRYRAERGLQGNDWPMFIAKSPGALPNFPYHMTSNRIAYHLMHVVSRVTGLKTNARRFRITLAQRAVDDGKDKHTVAELLDHSDTQNVGVYYEASPAMVPRLDRHLAMELAPIAQAFAGVVVTVNEKQGLEVDPSARIFDRSLNNAENDALGSCGQMSFCGLAIPFACYTCRHFKPWRDGPHEEFMGALIDDRDRMIAEEMSPKLYTIRDRTILAVAEVIQLCAAHRDGEEVAA
ncbi:site-specific integrase [Rhizobium sp. P38BS-XIX]|uniref:site-specific integrase n=1 Tax=Rhizobium sp. P38BS-XIX TaxID=2726740 RepID=UPI001456E077|nr:site-specific integrase [Rhizobium sp. P38BS-XIX]NLR96057.1 site-specific integrase [Rhizobium sp. P38BS-XIX]